MTDQILKAKDDLGTPHDTAGQLSDGSWGIRFVGELTEDQIELLQDISDDATRILGHVQVDNAIALDSATLAALENITVTVSNFPVDQPISGTVALDSTTLTALETISVANFPSEYDISDRVGRLLGVISGTVSVSNMIPAVETGLNKEVTQALVYARLGDIKNAVESIAIDADSISITADTINLSTDELESILQEIRDNAITSDSLQATSANQAIEITRLTEIRDTLNDGIDVDTGLDLSTLATAANQVTELAKLQEVVDSLEQEHGFFNEVTAALTPGEVNTSPWRYTGTYPSITVFCYFYASAPASVVLQWSDDGISQNSSAVQPVEVYASNTLAGLYTGFLGVNSQSGTYCRIVTTNGPDTQFFNAVGLSLLIAPFTGIYKALNSTAPDYEVALLARAVQAGLAFDGSFTNAHLPEHTVDAPNSLTSPLANGTITAFTVDEPANTIESIGHGLVAGDAVVLSTTGILPAPLLSVTTPASGVEKIYWVINPTTDDFQLTANINAASPTAVNITDTGTGTHSYQKRGQFLGTFKDYSQVGNGLDFFLDVQRPALLQSEWSADGVTVGGGPTGLFSTSARAITTTPVFGFGDFYINLTVVQTMIAKYRRVRLVNGPGNQIPGLYSLVTFIGKGNYPGSFGALDASISTLSTALLTRSVQAGTRLDGTFANIAIPEHDRDLQNEQVVPLINGTPVPFVADDALNTLTAASHGLVVDQCVHFTTDGTLPAPLTATGHYFVRSNPNVDDFQISTTRGGSAVNLTDTGTGVHSYSVAGEFNGEYTRVGDVDHFEILYASMTTLAAVEKVWSGDGERPLDRVIADGVTNSTTTLVCATGFFTRYDRGSAISGAGIPAGTIISAVLSATTVTLSNAATATATGVTITLNHPFSPGAITPITQAPYTVYYDLNEGRNMAPFYKFHVINGVSNQSLFPGFINLTWLMRSPYTGSYGLLDASLSQLSKALLTRSVNAGFTPDGTFSNISAQGRDPNNSSTTLLVGGVTYRGIWFPWQQRYVKMVVDVAADVAGTLYIDFSEEAIPLDGDESSLTGDPIIIEYDPAFTPLMSRHFVIQSRWVRIRFINGAAAQSNFDLDTAFVISDPGTGTLSLDTLPSPRMLAGVMRVVPALPDGTGSGEYAEVPVDGDGIPEVHITDVDVSIQQTPANESRTSQKTVGTSAAVRLDPDPMPGRVACIVSNMEETTISGDVVTLGHGAVYGHVSTLVSADGADLPAMAGRAFMADETVEIWAIAKPGAGSTNTQDLTGTSFSGTGSNTSNAENEDGSFASESAAAQTVDVSAYSISPTLSTVQQVVLGMVARKEAGQTELGAVADATAFTGTSTAGTVSTSGSVTGGTAMTYLAFVARDLDTHNVTGVTGLGLTWTMVTSQVSDDGNREVDCWVAKGTATTGVVTASFDTLPTNSLIDVLRFTGIDQNTPVQASGGTAANATTVNGPTIAGTNRGIAVLAVANINRTNTAGTGYTERSDHAIGGGASQMTLFTSTKPLVATGDETGQETMSGGAHYAAIGVTLLPAPAPDPTVRLSYKLSGTPGSTTQDITIGSTAFGETLLDVTGDRSWIFGDVPNVEVIATAVTVGLADIEIDQLFLRVVETSAPTCRISLQELAVV